ncbi:MAG: pro-sigmaK processing inhibitor BofA family protein [Suilimivivens sp.]|nr:pro-sigmaK processing inhibitor BofA family protein [Lachnospiraceae bacterium]MDY5868783.1 pro-sigmaK processing inhibitor BofA family protein [Lachnospiraceae bacterium]
MDTYTGIFYIVAILAIVLFIGVFKNRAEWIINLILRGISGMLMIYFLNFLFEKQYPAMEMGYNLVTFLTSAILGFPGVAMLYGINFYMIL